MPRSQRTAAPAVKEALTPSRPLHEQRLAPNGLGHFDRQCQQPGLGRRTPRLSPPRHQSWPPRQTWQPPRRRVAGGFGGSGPGRCSHQCRSKPTRTCNPPCQLRFTAHRLCSTPACTGQRQLFLCFGQTVLPLHRLLSRRLATGLACALRACTRRARAEDPGVTGSR